MDSPTFNPIDILLVEDNPGDVRLIQEMLKDARVLNTMHVANDGEEAMAFLSRSRPDLILLDLNLPNKDGREVLRDVRNDQELKYIPVVIVTSSEHEDDINQCNSLNATCYITKPLQFEHLRQIVQAVEWLGFTIVKKK